MIRPLCVVASLLLAGCTSIDDPVDQIAITSGDSCWSGTIRDDDGSRSVEGCADASYDTAGGHTYALISKSDSGTWELCVELSFESETVRSSCTTAERGTINIAS